MASLHHVVISLRTGKPFEPPAYRDRRGSPLQFKAQTCDGWIAIQATRTVFGLALHRRVFRPGSIARWVRWSISEPQSGLSIVSGATRQDALTALSMQVAYLGGEDEFLAWIGSATAAQPICAVDSCE